MDDILGVPFYDDDFLKMLFRFTINTIFLIIIVNGLYFRNTKNRQYLFTYYLIGIIVFLLCFTLKKNELDIGMALGLFAIFGIIRYRTTTIRIKEMTYLFVIIGISVINSLANKKMSYLELLVGNLIIVFAIAILEKYWLTKPLSKKTVLYEKIELIKPENREALVQDLGERTGLKIVKVSVGDVNFLRDTAEVTIFYEPEIEEVYE